MLLLVFTDFANSYRYSSLQDAVASVIGPEFESPSRFATELSLRHWDNTDSTNNLSAPVLRRRHTNLFILSRDGHALTKNEACQKPNDFVTLEIREKMVSETTEIFDRSGDYIQLCPISSGLASCWFLGSGSWRWLDRDCFFVFLSNFAFLVIICFTTLLCACSRARLSC